MPFRICSTVPDVEACPGKAVKACRSWVVTKSWGNLRYFIADITPKRRTTGGGRAKLPATNTYRSEYSEVALSHRYTNLHISASQQLTMNVT